MAPVFDMSKKTEAQPAMLPLLPLRQVSLMPEQEIRLFVGRDSSQNALRIAMATESCVFAVTQREPNQEIPDIVNLYPIGTAAQVKSQRKLPDGKLMIVLLGQWRGRVTGVRGADGYLVVDVERVGDSEDAILEMGPPPAPVLAPADRPDDVIESIAVPGFDPVGDVFIDRERGGSLWLLFEQMPPSWVPRSEYADFGRCAKIDKEIELAIGAPVLWDDRERFYIEHPPEDCIGKIREFLADFRARNEPQE
jgi:hypothetical protein